MSRKSKMEYIGEKRRLYQASSPGKRRRILDEVCETVGCSRKYVNKLLTGNIRYSEHKGRGNIYSPDVLATARRIWETIGCPHTTYFVVEMERIVREYEACVALIKPASVKNALVALSASTLDRAFKGLPRSKPGFRTGKSPSGHLAPPPSECPVFDEPAKSPFPIGCTFYLTNRDPLLSWGIGFRNVLSYPKSRFWGGRAVGKIRPLMFTESLLRFVTETYSVLWDDRVRQLLNQIQVAD